MGLLDWVFGRKKTAAPVLPPPEPEAPPTIQAANVQGIGGREDQEDSFALLNVTDRDALERDGLFAVLADGMGGLSGGRAASQIAVEELCQAFRAGSGEDIPAFLERAARNASRAVFDACGGQSGSTLLAAHWKDGLLHWVSVGDSAIFLSRNGGVFQLNREHTYLNTLYGEELDRDPICRQRAECHPDAHRLTAFVGMEELPDLDLSLRPLTLLRGDTLLLCSDGISGVLSPAELLEAMSLPPAEGCALLETMVLEKGLMEQDNYTGVLITCR